MNTEPQKEHNWLDKFVGEWTYETEAASEPGKPSEKYTGTESVRSLNGIWILCEGKGEVPGGGTSTTMMTLGYDPLKKRYVGTFIGSMMTYLWLYEGDLDPTENALTLEAEGPSFTAEGQMGKYKDVIEFKSDDHRVMTSNFLGDDGNWHEFMRADYRRTK